MSIGLITTTSYGLYQLATRVLLNSAVSALVRLGIAALAIGLCTLLISVARERVLLLRADKYRRIKR